MARGIGNGFEVNRPVRDFVVVLLPGPHVGAGDFEIALGCQCEDGGGGIDVGSDHDVGVEAGIFAFDGQLSAHVRGIVAADGHDEIGGCSADGRRGARGRGCGDHNGRW